MSASRTFKDGLYGQYARLGKALASPHRIEALELLAQAERSVDSLATELQLSIANASQHLKVLREAGLVETRRNGLVIHYRLADPVVSDLCHALRHVAERRYTELERLVRDQFSDRTLVEPVRMDELMQRARRDDVVILDARPANEFLAGHVAGAISAPIETLQKRLRSLPKNKDYVAYCRGPYCVYADQAVALLRKSGRRAQRLSGGFPDWKAAGFPVEIGA
jgi:rhodanese-related sulfurtransferase/DNA-binding transcriptional ArsR family regulator